jgi:glutamate-1-semialdehyde 2,1-aminomutase
VASSFHKAKEEEYPIFATHGRGSKLYDVDGNEYIDYVAGFGPLILGHAPEPVIRAVAEQLRKGSHFSAPTRELCELSGKLTRIIPCAEKVIYQNTGTEAVMTAFRIARGYTGRSRIVKFEGQYHGWSDEEKITIDADSVEELGPVDNVARIMNGVGQRKAAADDMLVAPWNDLPALEAILHREEGTVAAVVMEPFMCDSGPILPNPGYLQGVKEACEKRGVLLFFDEVITGFRMALGGAQAYFGVTPHIATFAKAIGAGFPLSVVAGKKEIMDCGVHASGTFNANAMAVAAALATIAELEKPGTYERFQELGDMLCDGIRELGKKHSIPIFCRACASIVMIQFGTDTEATSFRDFLAKADVPRYQRLYLAAGRHGIRMAAKRGRLYLSTRHTKEDIRRTLDVFDHVFGRI